MKILVTGASGLVGRNLVSMNIDSVQWIAVSSKDADLSDYNQTLQLIKRESPDGIIHLAANVGGLYKNLKQPVEMFEDNILINTHVLKAAHSCNVSNVVVMLSTCIFPDGIIDVITPDMLHNGTPHYSNEGYAYAKRMSEVQTRLYQKEYGRRYFCIVPTNIYGPYDNYSLENGHVIASLVHKCHLAKQNNKPFIVLGDGKPVRQFIYVSDLCEYIVWAYMNYTDISKPFFAIPPSPEVSISEIAEIISKEFLYSEHIEYDTSVPSGQSRKTGQVNDIGIKITSITDGIRKTIEFFQASQK